MKKQQFRRVSTLLIIICLLFTSFYNFIPKIIAQNEGDTANLAEISIADQARRYFGNQLGTESDLNDQMKTAEVAIYQTLEKMKADEIFMKGNVDCPVSGSIDVSDKGLLLQAFTKARDAFKMDNPDLFYIDYDKLSIRASDNGSVYIGIGRSTDYLLQGFTAENIPEAIQKYENKINEIVSKAELSKANDTSGDESIGIMNEIIYVHDYLVENMMYKYENECTKADGSICNHRTAYDGLINQEGVCEAYTRSFKAVLDRLQIPTICVYGLYKAKDTFSEEHIWNYVYWNNAWYGVDVTHDDPTPRDASKKNLLKTELENRDYFMVSETELGIHHLPSGVFSSLDYSPFNYPGISLESQQNNKTLYNNDGLLKVKLNKTYYSEDLKDEAIPSADIYVSYQGHSISWNAKNHKYVVAKFSQYRPGTDTWTQMDWAYVTPELYPAIDEVENSQNPDSELGDGYTKMPVPHIGKIQFAVTDVPPDTSVNGVLKGGLYYQGDPLLLESVTEEIQNPWGTYIAPPYPKKTTPGLNGRLYIGKTYDITLEYDDKLVSIDGEDFDISIDTTSYYDGLHTALENCQISDKQFIEPSTIKFKFTPSDMYNDDLTMYIFNIKGLKGEQSNKRPIPVSYVFAFGSNVGCSRVRADGGEYYAYGQPKLLANEDVSKNLRINTGENNQFETIDESISHRLTLVAKQASSTQQKELTEFVEKEEHVDVKACETYNIQLNLCKKQILKTGDRVKVCVGFPLGYSINDVGVSFVAYHYLTNENNRITGVEEIPCEVTRQGLVIWVQSFSPFMIAATDKPADQTKKTLSFNISDGGSAQVDSTAVTETTLLELKNNETKTVKITPNEGYQIDSVNVNGKPVEVNSKGDSIEISATNSDYFLTQTAIDSAQVNINFVSNTAKARDTQRPDTSALNTFGVKISEGSNILTATPVGNNDQAVTYQWYKDEQPIQGGTTPNLNIAKDKTRVGTYKVVASVGNEGTAITASASKAIGLPNGIFTITLNPNGGEFNTSKLSSLQITTGENGKLSQEDINKICDPEAVTKIGYEFVGWSRVKDSSVAELNLNSFNYEKFESDMPIYAVWKTKENEYLINLNLEGSKLNITQDNLQKEVTDEELANINKSVEYFIVDNGVLKDSLGNIYKSTPAATKTGYAFSGWLTGENTTVKNFQTVSGNITVSPSFSIYDDNNKHDESYDIVLNPNGGSLNNIEDTYELNKNDDLELPIPLNNDNYFAGWYSENDTGYTQPITKVVMDDNFINLHYKLGNLQTHSVTLVAYWISKTDFNLSVYPESIDSSLDKNQEINKPGHISIVSLKQGNSNIPITAPKEGDIVTYKAYPSIGYKFDGWTINGKPVESVQATSTKSNDNTELTIKFSKKDKVVALFEKEGETQTKEFTVNFKDNVNSSNNQTIKVKDGLLPDLPEVKEKNFEGWYTEETGGTKVEKGYPVISDMTLYAHYSVEPQPEEPSEPVEQFKISADVSPEKAGTVKGTGTYLKGDNIALEAIPNEGYQFSNWTVENKIVSSDKILPITVEKSLNYTAHFTKDSELDPDHQFRLENTSIYLTTLEDGKTEEDIVAVSDNPLSYEWENNTPTVISVIKSNGNKLTVRAISEGIGFITAKSGEVERTARVVVSDDTIVINKLFAYSDSPDEVTIEASGVLTNPALKNENEVDSLSIFAWSKPDQSDINAKVIDKNKNGDWSITIPVNDNETHNYFDNSNKINIHFYAHTDKGLEMVGSTVYNYSTNSYGNHNLIANGYAQNIGFIKPAVYDDNIIGTTGESRHLEGIRLASPLNGVDLSYSVHMSEIGWGDETSEGTYAGTMGQNRQLEAVRINLNGQNADNYTIQYRAHVADKGWLDWVNEGEMAGTEGEARQLEAIEVRILEK